MKTLLTTKSALIGLMGAMLSVAGGNAWAIPGGGILNSAHDFSGAAWNASGEICVVCHTPHGADISVTEAPLWNHAVTSKVFTPYSSPSFNGSATITLPEGSTKLCLSCHDGTVAVDAFGGAAGSISLTGDLAVGADDINNDHPISFDYTSALATADGGLHDPSATTVTTGTGSFIKTGTIQDVMLLGDKVQCASCHDVHNDFTQQDPLLRVSNTASGLCLTCHNK